MEAVDLNDDGQNGRIRRRFGHRAREATENSVGRHGFPGIRRNVSVPSVPRGIWQRSSRSLPRSNRKIFEMAKETRKPLPVFLRAAFFSCLIALAVLSWLPATIMTRTILGGHAEHFVAYLGTAMLMGLTFQKSPRLTVQCVLLIVYAAVLEAGQLYSAGRHASFQDLAFGAAGVVIGGLFFSMARTRVLSWLRLN